MFGTTIPTISSRAIIFRAGRRWGHAGHPSFAVVTAPRPQEAVAEIHHRLAGRGQMVRGELIHPAARTTKTAGSISSGIEGISKGYTVISPYQEGNF